MASRWACAPGNAGSSDGWILMIRSGNARMNDAETRRMKPAKTTSSTRLSRRTFSIACSNASRSFPNGVIDNDRRDARGFRAIEDRRPRHVANEDREVDGQISALARVHEALEV